MKKGHQIFRTVGVIFMLISVFGFAAACHHAKDTEKTETTIDPKAATLSFSMARDGGKKIEMTIEDESIVEYTSKSKEKDEQKGKKGGSYTRTYIFTGKKAGTTSLTVEEYLHGDLRSTTYYIITVDDDLKVTIEKDEDRVDPEKMPVLIIGDREILIKVEKNKSAELAFAESKKMSLGFMDDVDGNEKAAWTELPFSDEELKTIEVMPGDVICYHKTRPLKSDATKEFPLDFAIVYAPHTTECVVIGHLVDIDQDELTELLNQDEKKVLRIPRQ